MRVAQVLISPHMNGNGNRNVSSILHFSAYMAFTFHVFIYFLLSFASATFPPSVSLLTESLMLFPEFLLLNIAS